ncbi:MAG: TonB family protein [Bacteroidetes bacterium]|jgi:protein TonB|nr:TonB family protein [Bacteroidota bacterium]
MPAIRKEEGADLQKNYRTRVLAGLAIALLISVAAFQMNLTPGERDEIVMQDQEIVEMEEIQQTEQVEEPPPPPRPPVPVEVPDDANIADEDLDMDMSFDPNEAPDTPPPPPSNEEEGDDEPEIFQVVEDMPQPVGGMAGIQQRINYPDIARRAGVEGRVIVQFVVDENGNVQNPQVVRGIGAGADEEAIRVLRETEFTPGMQRGRPVPVRMSWPVTFRLQ